METYKTIWVFCFLGMFVLTPLIMIWTNRMFTRLESASPEIFTLGGLSNFSVQKPFVYWSIILSGKTEKIGDVKLRMSSRFLRVLFVLYFLIFIFVASGIFVGGMGK